VGWELGSGFPGVVTMLIYEPLWLVLLLSGSEEGGFDSVIRRLEILIHVKVEKVRLRSSHARGGRLTLCCLRLRGGAFGGAGAFEDIGLGLRL
jgi:hypothetical protein